jgi:iron-sulfur cluster assembly accessory protein
MTDLATSTVPVKLTDRASRRIAEIVAEEPQGTVLRVSVEGGGCSYKFDLVDRAADDDTAIGQGTGRVVIDPVSLAYLEGAEIDFVDDLMGATFKIENPNATASCGCGTSFSL